jgi:hypothetical protein
MPHPWTISENPGSQDGELFLGSYRLAEAIDEAGADLAVRGHAHFGSEQGLTPGGCGCATWQRR